MARPKKKAGNMAEILRTLSENRTKIKSFGVTRIGLFGSHSRGETTGSSDLDFVVVFRKKSFDSYMALKFYLEDLFGSKVDLVMSDTIKTRLRPRILKEAVYAPGL